MLVLNLLWCLHYLGEGYCSFKDGTKRVMSSLLFLSMPSCFDGHETSTTPWRLSSIPSASETLVWFGASGQGLPCHHGGIHDHSSYIYCHSEDPSGKLWCNGLGVAQNIISTSAGSSKTVDKVILELYRKLTGMAFCVPIPNVTAMNSICSLMKFAKCDNIKKVVKQVSKNPLKGILSYTRPDCILWF